MFWEMKIASWYFPLGVWVEGMCACNAAAQERVLSCSRQHCTVGRILLFIACTCSPSQNLFQILISFSLPAIFFAPSQDSHKIRTEQLNHNQNRVSLITTKNANKLAKRPIDDSKSIYYKSALFEARYACELNAREGRFGRRPLVVAILTRKYVFTFYFTIERQATVEGQCFKHYFGVATNIYRTHTNA